MSKDFNKFYEINQRYLDNLTRSMRIDLWDRQDEICYHAKGYKYPVLTPDAYDIIEETFDKEIARLREDVCMAFLDSYYRDIIDPGEWREDLREHFGWDYDDWENDLADEVYFDHNHERMTRPSYLSY